MTAPRPMAPRPGILAITPYEGGESAIPGRADAIKLSSNEGALGPSPLAVAAFERAAAALPRYPDGSCRDLRAAIGRRFGLDPARIVCGAGSDELLGLLAKGYAGEGDEVIYSEHGFLMYPIAARAVGAEPVKAKEAGLRTDIEAVLACAGNRTRIVYLANPNNPTGSYLTAAELRRLRERLPEGVLLVLDAAYAEFVSAPDYEAGARLVDDYGNVVMTRTFSKIFGLAGLRLGWAYAPADVVEVLDRLRMPFNVSAPAQAAGIAALGDIDHFEAARAHNERMRARLAAGIREAGITVPPSAANFVLARFPGGAAQAASADAFLKSRGVIVRRMAKYGLPDSLRITVGLGPEVEALIEGLTAFMAQAEGAADGG
ncbi:MAG TPA: histidinol-phosphate transaminase [Alphaproteobacteria bacterium]